MGKSAEEAPTRDAVRTKRNILLAAMREFAGKGFEGARIDAIAASASANKRMIYHYFGSKAQLYIAVLEHIYGEFRRKEGDLNLDHLPPVEAIEALVDFTFAYFIQVPEFIKIVNDENLRKARFLKQSERILTLHSPLVSKLREILHKGAAAGRFRHGVDPVELYISIAALCYFYLSNAHTLGVVFGKDLLDSAALDRHRNHAKTLILAFLTARS